ncbi:hypothetical protein [Vitreimonas flagellata]|uniref:hypothetical protein n=1 Tax=Vitreimonas flagellata TaxID=2560861 RepID=UPI00107524D4|nr:hypothetical protein [Vitreimonas flagellata]
MRRPKELHWLDLIERVRGQAKTGLDILEGDAHLISVERTLGLAGRHYRCVRFVALTHPSLVGESYPALSALSVAANARTSELFSSCATPAKSSPTRSPICTAR